jgi:glycosyltransferase involved in cell wall biosynthesis
MDVPKRAAPGRHDRSHATVNVLSPAHAVSSPNGRTSPLVSVVSPCFNQASYVGEMVRSVRKQTMSSWELIVVDNGSTDKSSSMALAAAEGDPRVSVERIESNRGVAAARNYGAARASESSHYILFLDADDELEPRMLELMITPLESEPSLGMAHCPVRFVDAASQPLSGSGHWPRYTRHRFGIRELRDDECETPFLTILAGGLLIPSAGLMRRSVFARTGGWDESFGQGFEDTDLFLRLALEAPVRLVPESLVRYRRHESNSSCVPGRHDEQLEKLHNRWRATKDWPEPKASVVRDAWRFHDRQLVWAQGRMAAKRLVRSGQPLTALRFLGGSLRVVLASLLRPPG